MSKREIRVVIAEFLWNLPLKMGFSRESRFQQFTLWLGDKFVFRNK